MREVEKFVRSLALLCASVWIVIHITSQTVFVATVIGFVMCGLSALAMWLNKQFLQMAAALAALVLYIIGNTQFQLVYRMMDAEWIWFPEIMLIMFNIFWNEEPNEKERAISMVASVWIIVSIQAIRNSDFFWTIMVPGFKGTIFGIVVAIIGIKAILKKRRDVAVAASAAFVLLVYFLTTWTSVPVSEVIANSFILMIPTILIYVVNGVIENTQKEE